MIVHRKNYFEQYTGLVEIGYFTTSDSTISIWHMAGLCRLLLLSLQKVSCVVSWSILLGLEEKKIRSEPFQHSQMLNAIFLICESNSCILFTETKVYKSNTWNKKSGYSTSIWAVPQGFLSTQEQGTWQANSKNIYDCQNLTGTGLLQMHRNVSSHSRHTNNCNGMKWMGGMNYV